MAHVIRPGERKDATFASDGFTMISPGFWEPGLMACDCGATIEMEGPGDDVDCDRCGRAFNAWGQELAPPECWGDCCGEHPADAARPCDPGDADW